MLSSPKTKQYILFGVSLLGIVVTLFLDPIGQNQEYHDFADERKLFGIANFWNVITNLPFVITGLLGIFFITENRLRGISKELKYNYLFFFAGIALVAAGSGYYHWEPSDEKLLWDRLPMTIAFMAFFSIIIGEFISVRKGKVLLIPFLIIGLFSVLYWYFSEQTGQGDLRIYILVQFLPLVLIPLILLVFTSNFQTKYYEWIVILSYAIAKSFELADNEIYEFWGIMSGHSIKHIFAALAPCIFLIGLYKRRPLNLVFGRD